MSAEWFERETDADERFDLTGLRSETTGLPFVVWIADFCGALPHIQRKGVRFGQGQMRMTRRSAMVIMALVPDVRIVFGALPADALSGLVLT
jgi:hypothetical protein